MLTKREQIREQLRLCNEGMQKSASYSRNKGLPSHLRKEGIAQAQHYRKRILELLAQLYKA